MIPQARPGRPEHASADLETLFQRCFLSSHHTRLEGGGTEPLYLPAGDGRPYHRIIYRGDYFASALHEIAHWCIAGPRRRQLVDYGYWYHPDNRGQTEQRAFESVEAKPQALEWVLSAAAGYPFRVSLDNLSDVQVDARRFKRNVVIQARNYCRRGLPPRAAQLVPVLIDRYGSATPLAIARYSFSAI